MRFLKLGIAALLWVASAALAQTEPVREFNVPPQSLEAALRQVAAESNLQILYDPKDVRGLNTQGVRGSMSPRQAIEKLLDGTGISVSFGESGADLPGFIGPIITWQNGFCSHRGAHEEEPIHRRTNGCHASRSRPHVDRGGVEEVQGE
jgi:hypothetical protein